MRRAFYAVLMSVMKRVHKANDYAYICIVCNKKPLHRNIPVQGQMRQDWCGGVWCPGMRGGDVWYYDTIMTVTIAIHKPHVFPRRPTRAGRDKGIRGIVMFITEVILKFISRTR